MSPTRDDLAARLRSTSSASDPLELPDQMGGSPVEPVNGGASHAGVDGFRYTESGNADRLVAAHGSDIAYVPSWPSWLTWDGRRWKVDVDAVRITELAKDVNVRMLARIGDADGTDERRQLLRHVDRSESHRSLRATVALARTMPGVVVDHGDLDAAHMWLTVENGDIDLQTGVLRPHDPGRRSTKLAPVRRDPAAQAPEFVRMLERIVPDPAERAYLARFAGYCLTGSVEEQMIAIWHGSGANGKSTLVKVLRRLLGDYAATAKRELLLSTGADQHPTALADLFGARLAECSELKEGAALDEARVKALTGGDTISARRMRQDFWEFEPTHKLVVTTNHRPMIRSDDAAIWRRVHLVPFNVTIPPDEIDRKLGDRIIANELPGVLNWAIEGLAEWQERGLNPPASILSATNNYRTEVDTVAAFMADEGVAVVDGAKTASTTMQECHTLWCEANGINPRSHWHSVQQRLKEQGATAGKSNRYRFWRHVAIVDRDAVDAG